MPTLDFAPGTNTQRGAWVKDFQLVDGYVHVKSTGVRFKNDWQLWQGYRPLVHLLRVRAACTAREGASHR